MSQEIYQIYDKVFKKILTLSAPAVVNLINGLFDTNYPADSIITYNWTEFHDDELKRILADTIVTINGSNSYHLEAQMTEDDTIILRVFEYGFSYARRTSTKNGMYYKIKFPEAKIIYLYSNEKIPDKYILTLDFGTQGTFDYEIFTFKFLETSVETLNQKKMVILIPFMLLKMRKAMEKERSSENLEELKNIIQNDIIGSINDNLRVGNITADDARKLKRLTHKLYEHIYSHYNELEVLNEMTDESLMLDIDIIEKQHEEEIARIVAEKNEEMYNKLAEKDNKLAEKDNKLAEKDREIAELKRMLIEKENSK